MKLVVVEFQDAVDTTILGLGTTVSISDGTNNVQNGTVQARVDMVNPPPPELIPHSHPAQTLVGPAQQ